MTAFLVPGLAGLAGCELVAGLRDIKEVSGTDGGVVEGGVVDTGVADAATTSDSSHDAVSHDVMPEVGVPDAPYASNQLELIDDMEGMTGVIADLGGRTGNWFTYNDMSATGHQTPIAGGTFMPSENDPARAIPENLGGGKSHYASQTSGNGFAVWGAGMGFNFTNPRATYDVTAYTGFVFWARIGSKVGAADGGVANVRFNVPDMNTDPSAAVCTACSDYLGYPLTLTTDWQEFTILFTQLAQLGFGAPYEAALDAAHVYGCQFLITTDASIGNSGAAFDVWVDDIYFIKKSK
jgi:hypothetical protein